MGSRICMLRGTGNAVPLSPTRHSDCKEPAVKEPACKEPAVNGIYCLRLPICMLRGTGQPCSYVSTCPDGRRSDALCRFCHLSSKKKVNSHMGRRSSMAEAPASGLATSSAFPQGAQISGSEASSAELLDISITNLPGWPGEYHSTVPVESQSEGSRTCFEQTICRPCGRMPHGCWYGESCQHCHIHSRKRANQHIRQKQRDNPI